MVVRIALLILRVHIRALLIRGGEHDQAMQRLQFPAATDQFAREIVEQFRMRWRAALDAEVIDRRDDALPEMLLPDAVHDHPREQVSGSGLGVRHPVPERHARVEVRRREPALRLLRRQHLDESRRRLALLAVHLAAPQQEDLPSTADCRVDLRRLRLRHIARVVGHGVEDLLARLVRAAQPAHRRGAVRLHELPLDHGQQFPWVLKIHASGENIGQRRRGRPDDVLHRRRERRGGHRQAQPPDGIRSKIQAERQHRAALEPGEPALNDKGRGVFHARFVLRPPARPRLGIHGLGDRHLLFLEPRLPRAQLQLHGRGLVSRGGRRRDDAEFREVETAVARQAGPGFRELLVRESVEPHASEVLLKSVGDDRVADVVRIIRGWGLRVRLGPTEERDHAVWADFEGGLRAARGDHLEGLPARIGRRFRRRRLAPFIQAGGQFLRLKFPQRGLQ